jgi:hypothetical protein
MALRTSPQLGSFWEAIGGPLVVRDMRASVDGEAASTATHVAGGGRAPRLLAEGSDERQQDETSADADEQPSPKIVQKNAESDSYDDPAGKCGAAVAVPTSGRTSSIS